MHDDKRLQPCCRLDANTPGSLWLHSIPSSSLATLQVRLLARDAAAASHGSATGVVPLVCSMLARALRLSGLLWTCMPSSSAASASVQSAVLRSRLHGDAAVILRTDCGTLFSCPACGRRRLTMPATIAPLLLAAPSAPLIVQLLAWAVGNLPGCTAARGWAVLHGAAAAAS